MVEKLPYKNRNRSEQKLLLQKTCQNFKIKTITSALFLTLLTGCVGSNDILSSVEPNNAAPPPTINPVEQNSQATFQSAPLGRALPQPRTSQLNLQPEEPTQPANSTPLLSLVTSDNPQSTSTNPLKPDTLNSLENNIDENGVSIGVSSNSQIDPIKTAAIKRVNKLYTAIDHGKCNSEFGPKPKRVEAKRINAGDPYYVEFRMRNTPLMPVGHTFVVYGNLDANGEPIDERMAMLAPQGGYAGASLAAAVPVPGVLKPYGDDCKIRPETAYRVSLSPKRYEAFLVELQKAKTEKAIYMLFAQNCNHFTQRMADAIGVLPPKNKYVPAVDYLYDIIESNEGIKIDRRFRSKVAGIPDWPTPKTLKQ